MANQRPLSFRAKELENDRLDEQREENFREGDLVDYRQRVFLIRNTNRIRHLLAELLDLKSESNRLLRRINFASWLVAVLFFSYILERQHLWGR